jgi:hypothetical protein
LWVLDPQRMRAVRVSEEPSGRPAWSYDGQYLSFDKKLAQPASIYRVSTKNIHDEIPHGLTDWHFQRHAAGLPLRG